MNPSAYHISKSITVLSNNLINIAQVGEWAEMMGYNKTKRFSRKFLRYYAIRPCKMMTMVRLKSLYEELREDNYSNFTIARRHSLPDEIALNKFVNYHLGCSPSMLKKMSEKQFETKMEKFGSKVR